MNIGTGLAAVTGFEPGGVEYASKASGASWTTNQVLEILVRGTGGVTAEMTGIIFTVENLD
jgi:hypothetical protein